MLTFGSLFSGIGGMDLGLEKAGLKCVWQVEINEFCRRVLAKHWPDVRRHDDVRTFPPTKTEEWRCDLICGGFPCQPVSNNGHMLAEADDRWLWPHCFTLLRLLRPRFVLLENVPGLLLRGMGEVLSGLSSIGYDAEWETLSAYSFGAPHRRERIFIVAYSDRFRREESQGIFSGDSFKGFLEETRWGVFHRGISSRIRMVPDCPDNCVGDGIPLDLDGIKGLGNAVVPQVAEWIGQRIIQAERSGY